MKSPLSLAIGSIETGEVPAQREKLASLAHHRHPDSAKHSRGDDHARNADRDSLPQGPIHD
jgi:hypothetical protein